MTVRIEHGDCLDVMRALAAGHTSVHAIVTDPPYGLKFMGRGWDRGVPGVDYWRAAIALLPPGGHLLAFGGTRTFHRMASAIEDAGFEIRDQLAWAYGSGFPKSLSVGKAIDKAAGVEREVLASGKPVKRMIPGADQDATGSWIKDNGREFVPTVTAAATEEAARWDGWGTALKPAWEPIVLARKPIEGTVAANVLLHGTGGLNIDGCRVESEGGAPRVGEPSQDRRYTEKGTTNFAALPGPRGGAPEGRWPANLCHDGSDEVVECFPEQSGGGTPARRISPKTAGVFGKFAHEMEVMPDGIGGSSGNAARFFFSAKADADDRCDSKHPTVKPVALMRWLARLITPPGGTVLDPFAGSGTTGVACIRESFNAILIEQEDEYVRDIRHRIDKLSGFDAPLFAPR